MRIAALLALSAALGLAPAAAAAADAFRVDPATSRVRIHLARAGLFKFLGHDHTIEAPILEGRVEVDADQPERSRVELRFDAAALRVVPGTEPEQDVPEVEQRMRSPEVLDVERHPRIAFVSAAVEVESAAGGGRRARIRGTLELKDRRVELTLPLVVGWQDGRLQASGEVELELRRLGIEPPSVAGVVKVANRFRLSFEIVARAEAPAVAPATEPAAASASYGHWRARMPASAATPGTTAACRRRLVIPAARRRRLR